MNFILLCNVPKKKVPSEHFLKLFAKKKKTVFCEVMSNTVNHQRTEISTKLRTNHGMLLCLCLGLKL